MHGVSPDDKSVGQVYLIVHNIIVGLIHAAAVGSGPEGICHRLDVRHFRDHADRPPLMSLKPRQRRQSGDVSPDGLGVRQHDSRRAGCQVTCLQTAGFQVTCLQTGWVSGDMSSDGLGVRRHVSRQAGCQVTCLQTGGVSGDMSPDRRGVRRHVSRWAGCQVTCFQMTCLQTGWVSGDMSPDRLGVRRHVSRRAGCQATCLQTGWVSGDMSPDRLGVRRHVSIWAGCLEDIMGFPQDRVFSISRCRKCVSSRRCLAMSGVTFSRHLHNVSRQVTSLPMVPSWMKMLYCWVMPT